MLVYKQLEDYWYEPPSDPSGYWTSHFDIRVVRSEEDARKLSGVGPRWVAIGEGAGAAARLGAVAAKDGAGKAGTGAKINDATVTTADVLASNGVIHVIDTVLIPPSP